ncbi:MAG: serine protease [Pirellulales bacterium]
MTGQQVCPLNQQQIRNPYPPALDSRPSALDSAAHCRITVGDGTAGSGTLVARSAKAGLVLTCSHLFDGSTAKIVVTFPNGQRFAAYLVERDRAHDLAALIIDRPDAEPVAVSEAEASGTLSACGFGPNGQFRCVRGSVVGHATPVGATHPSLTMSGAVRPGDSGGGVLDASGRLVGVVWGQGEGLTYATCGRPLRSLLARVLGRKEGAKPQEVPEASPQIDWQTWASEIETRIRALDAAKQDKGEYLRPGDLPESSLFVKRDELDGGLASVSGRFESILGRVETVRQRIEQVAEGHGGFFQGLSVGKLLVGALGLSGPVAAAVMVAGGFFAMRKSKLASSQFKKTVSSRPIAVDTPPPPQRIVPETHYVSYETDSFAKAHQWASEQVARKYPGATELLHAQESLIKQCLAGR